jgi:polyhydroxybutyrate depolymerase
MRPALVASLLFGCAAPRDDTAEGLLMAEMLAYELLRPTNANGKALIFLHGSNGDGERAMSSQQESTFLAMGFTMVYPEARDGMWPVQSGEPTARAAARSLRALRDQLEADDVAHRFAVAGHSLGGSMAWSVACYEGDAFEAFVPSSGTFHEPGAPSECPSQPVPLRHVHGTHDEIVPVTGQPEPDEYGAMQDTVYDSMELWSEHNRCDRWRSLVRPDETCLVGDGCDAPVELCLYDGGHRLPPSWELDTLGFLEQAMP